MEVKENLCLAYLQPKFIQEWFAIFFFNFKTEFTAPNWLALKIKIHKKYFLALNMGKGGTQKNLVEKQFPHFITILVPENQRILK